MTKQYDLYGKRLKQGVFTVLTLADDVILSSLFPYISASSFIFANVSPLPQTMFSYFFARNSVRLICGGLASNRLFRHGHSENEFILLGIAAAHVIAAGLLLLATLSGAAALILFAMLNTITLILIDGVRQYANSDITPYGWYTLLAMIPTLSAISSHPWTDVNAIRR